MQLDLWVRRRNKALVGVCAFCAFVLVAIKYVYLDSLDMALGSGQLMARPFSDNMAKAVALQGHPDNRKISYEELIADRDSRFDMRKKSDVMVFLHIQKTGGTVFERHLVRDLDLEHPCIPERGRKRYKCHRAKSKQAGSWIFSRYSSGWHCGLHADWTELTNCVDSVIDRQEGPLKRRYFYITLLREPKSRFLSEFRHVQRGATWKTARHNCNGRSPTAEELPACYTSTDWMDVTFDEFISCKSNLAVNRMTRMLADLTLVGCYNESAMAKPQRDAIMLASAKSNLQKMSFFALCEYQKISQYLFEWTFGLSFTKPFVQYNLTRSSLAITEVSSKDLSRIDEVNKLDVELYSFAKNLLFERFNRTRRNDPNFEENFNKLFNEIPHE